MDWNCATRVLFERSRIHCEWIRMLVSKVVTYIQQHCAMWHIVKPSAKKKKHAKRIDEYFTFALSSFHFVCVVHFSDWSICIQWKCHLNDTSSNKQHSDWIDWLNMWISMLCHTINQTHTTFTIQKAERIYPVSMDINILRANTFEVAYWLW